MTDPTRSAIHDIPFTAADGASRTLSDYGDDVFLIVNVASRCGLAPQYATLEQLQKTYADRGFTVLAFPSNQFLQELSKMDDILEYCATTWGVTFPVLEKIRVNGRRTAPLYEELKKTRDSDGKAGRVTWNFEKFLVTRNGETLRFRPQTLPDDPEIIRAIEDNLPA